MPKETSSFKGGLVVLPQNFFGFWGRKRCIPVSFWDTVLQYPYPLPLQKNFSSDCTDLKNGPDELHKAWKPEKPEKGWPR